MAAPNQVKQTLAGLLDICWDEWIAGRVYQFVDRYNVAGHVYKIVITKVPGEAMILIRIQRRDSLEDKP